MPTSLSPKYDDQLKQLNEKVSDHSKNIFEKRNWKSCDEVIRHLYEGLATTTIYAVKGETDGHDSLHTDPPHNTKPRHSSGLLTTAKDKCRDAVIPSAITSVERAWEDLINDFSSHNPQSHSNVGTNKERETNGYKNVKRGVSLLIDFLTDKIQNIPGWPAGTPTDMLFKFKEIGKRLQLILPYITHRATALELSTEIKEDLSALLGIPTLPDRNQTYYALILPANPSEKLRKALQPLMIFHWNFILDFGNQTSIGSIFPIWNQTVTERLNVLTDVKYLSDSLINWIFMRKGDGTGSKMDARKLFNHLAAHKLPDRNIIVFDLNEKSKEGFEALAGLWRLIAEPDDSQLSEKSFIFSVPESSGDSMETLLDEEDYKVGGLREISSDASDFMSALYGADSFPISPAPLSDIIPEGKRQQFLDGGLKFLDSDETYIKKALWDNFYAGRLITKSELGKQYDVFPRGEESRYRRFYRALKEGLSSMASREFFIRHLPGAGGSTLVRRMAFDLEQENDRNVITLWVSRWNPAKTPEQIKQLAQHLSKNLPGIQRWLVISDDKELNADEYSNLKNYLSRQNIPALFLRITHITTLKNSGNEPNILYLDSYIVSEREKEAFNDKFTKAFADVINRQEAAEIIGKIMKSRRGRQFPEMINYPYGFTEEARQKTNLNILPEDSYATKWLDTLSTQELKDTVGLIAFIYYFTNSQAIDINALRKLWDKSGHDFFPSSLSAEDADAVSHLIKISAEEGAAVDSSSLYAPRYGAFASQILDGWRPAWSSQIADITLMLIDTLPSSDEEMFHSILSSMLTSQSWQSNEPDRVSSRKNFKDRISPLINAILEKGGNAANVILIFNKLIEKYPDREFWKIHKARFLFEYASETDRKPDDKLFTDARKIIEDIFTAESVEDLCYHIAGVFWKRFEKATYLHRKDNLSTQEERENLIQDILYIGHQGIERFKEYNEAVNGNNSYGYISGAELTTSLIEHIAELRRLKGKELLTDAELRPLMEIRNDFLDPLEESEELSNSYTKSQITNLTSRFSKLIGKREDAIQHLITGFHEFSDDSRSQAMLGHQAVSMMLTPKDTDYIPESLKDKYKNLSTEEVRESEKILKILRDNNGDLMAARKLFYLYRYTGRDSLESSQTTDALRIWSSMAESQKSVPDILKASFLQYVRYAASIIDSPANDTSLLDEYRKWLKKSKELGESLEKNTGVPLLFLSRTEPGRWSSLLDPSEACEKKNKKLTYRDVCRRFVAELVEVNYTHQICRIGNLTEVSFAYRNLTQNDIGTKELYNGVLGFRYSGPGMYDQQVRPIGVSTLAESAPSTSVAESTSSTSAVESASDSSVNSAPDPQKKKISTIGQPKKRKIPASGQFHFKSSKYR